MGSKRKTSPDRGVVFFFLKDIHFLFSHRRLCFFCPDVWDFCFRAAQRSRDFPLWCSKKLITNESFHWNNFVMKKQSRWKPLAVGLSALASWRHSLLGSSVTKAGYVTYQRRLTDSRIMFRIHNRKCCTFEIRFSYRRTWLTLSNSSYMQYPWKSLNFNVVFSRS